MEGVAEPLRQDLGELRVRVQAADAQPRERRSRGQPAEDLERLGVVSSVDHVTEGGVDLRRSSRIARGKPDPAVGPLAVQSDRDRDDGRGQTHRG